MNLSMALTLIDLEDDGYWKQPTHHRRASRKLVAQHNAFPVIVEADNWYWVRRPHGSWHHAKVCIDGMDIMADCDCYDFQQYGAGFNRACMHIWYILLTQSGGIC